MGKALGDPQKKEGRRCGEEEYMKPLNGRAWQHVLSERDEKALGWGQKKRGPRKFGTKSGGKKAVPENRDI